MKYRKLKNTDLDVSVLSYGASSLGSVFREINEAEGIKTVHEVIDSGINLIDVSPYYGLTKAETVLGKALVDIPRDKYILSSKAGRYGENEFDFSRKGILTSVENSLQRLHTDYSEREYITLAYDYIIENHGNIEQYLLSKGISQDVLERVKTQLGQEIEVVVE